MKRIAIIAAIAMSASTVAHADPVSIAAPATPVSAEAAEAYVTKIEKAVKEVCRDAAAPIVGVAYYTYLNCIKDTRVEVAKQDPTGLYAKREPGADIVIAAK